MTNSVVHPDVQLSADGRTLAVHVPMQFRKRGGRKVVIAPAGAPSGTQSFHASQAGTVPAARVDAGLVKALTQAHRWQAMLDAGRYVTLGDLAEAEKLDKSFVARTLRLTLLAPKIIEAILDGKQLETAQRQTLLRGFPLAWEEQEVALAAV